MTIKAQTGPGASTPEIDRRRMATLAAACLLIDDAHLYGLIDGELLHVDRLACEELLQTARMDGIVPEHQETCEAALGIMAELGVIRR